MLEKAKKLLTGGKRLSNGDVAFMDETLRKLGGLGITEAEKIEILRAMDFSKGHWYKCPNGHVYAIGDCGGATVESK